MKTTPKNTLLDFKLEDGNIVKLTLTFGKLNVLKSVNNALYQKFNKILSGKSEEFLDLVDVIYVAYWCANFGNEKLISQKDFIELVPFDIPTIKEAFDILTHVKKKVGFRKPFIDKTGKTKKPFRLPNFDLEDIEDYYTYYVLILKISEDVFWNSDYSFLKSIVENKVAFDNYINYMQEKTSKR